MKNKPIIAPAKPDGEIPEDIPLPGEPLPEEEAEVAWQPRVDWRPPVMAPPESTEAPFPTGFHDQQALKRILDSGKPYEGLVISVGVREPELKLKGPEGLRSISNFLITLLRDTDFACRTGADEFVLLCPGSTGAAARRHISLLSERLREFQRRSIGAYGAMFSLGSAEVQGASLAGGISSAVERMRETRRARKLAALP